MPKEVLDPDLETGLKQAKKKPRNYAIVAKGPKVLKLIVERKPIREGELIKAKSEFKGDQVIRGVVVSDGGQEMAFQLVGEEPSIRIQAFKEFISEQTGLTIKPRFEVVKEIKEIDDDEGDEAESERPSATSEKPPEAPPKPPESQGTAPDTVQPELDELVAKMNKLAPLIQAAVKASPEKRGDLQSLIGGFRDRIKERNVTSSKETLLEVGKLVKSLVGGGGAGGKPVDVLAIWRDAKDATDSQLNTFVKALEKSGDDYLVKIAERGVQGFVEGPSRVFVTLMTSLMEFQSANGPAKETARKKAATAVASYKQFVDGSQFLEVCDTNDLCGPLTIRSTLMAALNELENNLSA